MPKPKAILPPKWGSELLPSDNQWAKLRRYIPEPLQPDDEARLCEDIKAACSWLLSEQARLALGRRTAAAMQRPSESQPALLERLARHLRAAADDWKKIKELADSPDVRRGVIYDDRLSDIRQYDALEAMALDVERRLAGIRKLGEAEYVDDPWPIFVLKVAQCFREIGLRPTATGRIYDKGVAGKPTWFQEFMAALDKDLLGIKRLIGIDSEDKEYKRDHRAFYAEIAKVLGGYRNPGKARKQITGR
jgi:hypothetical protein